MEFVMGWSWYELFRSPFHSLAGIRFYLFTAESVRTGGVFGAAYADRESILLDISGLLATGELGSDEAERIGARVSGEEMCENFDAFLDRITVVAGERRESLYLFRLSMDESGEACGTILVRDEDRTVEIAGPPLYSLRHLVQRVADIGLGLEDPSIDDLRPLWQLVVEARERGLPKERVDTADARVFFDRVFGMTTEELGQVAVDAVRRDS